MEINEIDFEYKEPKGLLCRMMACSDLYNAKGDINLMVQLEEKLGTH